MNPPQAKTSRYVRNLLTSGSNYDYFIRSISYEAFEVDGVILGNYYRIHIGEYPIIDNDFKPHSGVGATPEAALRVALTRAGVTFR